MAYITALKKIFWRDVYEEMYFNYRIPEADTLLSVQKKYGCKCFFEVNELDLTAHTLGEKTVV